MAKKNSLRPGNQFEREALGSYSARRVAEGTLENTQEDDFDARRIAFRRDRQNFKGEAEQNNLAREKESIITGYNSNYLSQIRKKYNNIRTRASNSFSSARLRTSISPERPAPITFSTPSKG